MNVGPPTMTKCCWGEKSPRDIYWIGPILEAYPNAQFLHIFRDGRDVAVDWLDNLDWPNNIYSTAQEWKLHTDAVKPWQKKTQRQAAHGNSL